MAKGINIVVTGATAPLRASLQNATKDVDRFGGSVKAGMARATLALGAGAVAAAALGREFVKGAEDARTAERRLDQVAVSMAVFGTDTSKATARLKALGDELERETGLTAETIKLTQAKLLTFRELALTADEAGGAFDRATVAALDLAAAGFGSAEQNAVQLGKALNDPIKGITALARSGVTFTAQEKNKIRTLVESNKVLEAQNIILEAIETQVGGTAAASATSSAKIANAFGEIKDVIGDLLLPVMDRFADSIQRIGAATTEGGGGGFLRQTTTEASKLTREIDGSVNTFGRFVNAAVRTRNVLAESWNAFDRLAVAVGFSDGNMIDAIDTLKDYTEEQKKAALATQGMTINQSDQIATTTKLIETQEQLNNVIGPVLSRNLQDLKAGLRAQRQETAATTAETKKATSAAKDLAKANKERLRDAVKSARDAVREAREAIANYKTTVMEAVQAGIGLAAAFDTQADADKKVSDALADRAKAYEALNIAKQKNDAEALADALAEVAKAETAVAQAQFERTQTGYLENLRNQVRAAEDFAKNLQSLREAGLGEAGLQQLLGMGAQAGGAAAREILAGGAQAITEVRDLIARGGLAGGAFAQAGVDATGLGAGLSTAQQNLAAAKFANQINVTVTSADPKAVVDALVKWSKQNGKLPPQIKVSA